MSSSCVARIWRNLAAPRALKPLRGGTRLHSAAIMAPMGFQAKAVVDRRKTKFSDPIYHLTISWKAKQ
jgi:hypothetical protein